MNSKRYLYNNVRQDREQGCSLSEIATKYGLSKSSVSLWCKGMKLNKKAKQRIQETWQQKTDAARAKGTLTNKQKRIDSIEKEYKVGRDKLGKTSDRDLFIMGVGLYWAEGSKKETGSGFNFINSDPAMIMVMYLWLFKMMKIKKDQFILTIAVNEVHRAREGDILKFWSNLLDFPKESFGNTIFIRNRLLRTHSNHNEYFGMLRIRVRSSSGLRRRIQGMIKAFIEANMPA